MDNTCDHGLSKRRLRAKISFALGWKLYVMMIKIKQKRCILSTCRNRTTCQSSRRLLCEHNWWTNLRICCQPAALRVRADELGRKRGGKNESSVRRSAVPCMPQVSKSMY